MSYIILLFFSLEFVTVIIYRVMTKAGKILKKIIASVTGIPKGFSILCLIGYFKTVL